MTDRLTEFFDYTYEGTFRNRLRYAYAVGRAVFLALGRGYDVELKLHPPTGAAAIDMVRDDLPEEN